MTTDMTVPATKQDILDLLQHIDGQVSHLYKANERWKNELHGDMEKWRDELRLHFDFTAERFAGDFQTINLEKIGDHDARIVHLEVITGVRK